MEELWVDTRDDRLEIEAVRQLVGSLSLVEVKAIYLRFWGPCTIEQIAAELRISWDMADAIIERALKRLRHQCADDPVLQQRLLRLHAA